MDVAGDPRAQPELCLVDELAHTNAPGVEHEKRYEDIDEILDAGIDVTSTVNVQHLESLNDEVFELTGDARARDVPRRSPRRGRRGRARRPDAGGADRAAARRQGLPRSERIRAALNNFFKLENLAALRETALRQVAEGVESKRLVQVAPAGRRDDRMVATAAPTAIGERLLALVTLHPRSQRVVRRAWRSAQRLGADLDLLVVRAPGSQPDGEDRQQLEALRRLASVLGANLLVEEGDDVADVAIRVACERGTTYVLIGAPGPRRGVRRFSDSLPTRLLRGLPGVDVRIVADRTLRQETPSSEVER